MSISQITTSSSTGRLISQNPVHCKLPPLTGITIQGRPSSVRETPKQHLPYRQRLLSSPDALSLTFNPKNTTNTTSSFSPIQSKARHKRSLFNGVLHSARPTDNKLNIQPKKYKHGERRRSDFRFHLPPQGPNLGKRLSDPSEEEMSLDGHSDSDQSLAAMLTEYLEEVETGMKQIALCNEQPWFSGSNLRYYRPLMPDARDNAAIEEGRRGKDEKRMTAPDIFAGIGDRDGSKQWQALASGKSDNSGGDSRNSLLNRLSVNSEPDQSKTVGNRRLSLALRSTSLVERDATEKKPSFRNTRKFIYSLARVAGKGGKDGKAEEAPRRGFASMMARSIGVRLMLRREQLMGGQRMAALGTLLAARKRFALADHVVMKFDATIVWRKLRLWVRIRSMLVRMHKEIKDRVTQDPSSPLYMLQLSEEDSMGIDRDHYMFFDPSDFKANRQMRTSQEVRRILTLPSEQRTSEDIHCAMIGLRAISTIAEYPVRMQRHLAEFGIFQSFEAKRAIVRQGSPPEGFYFLLYGRVLVAVRDEITGKVEIKCYLHRGHSFGELAIIRRTQRQSTVITKNYTELLCLPSEIFEKYFMVGGVKNVNDPDQVHFIQSLSFLRGWPMDLMRNATDETNISFGYFKRGSILSRDSNFSDWLIIVKSGSLSVLKKLVKAKPTASRKTGLLRTEEQDSILSFLDNGREYIRSLEPDMMTTLFHTMTDDVSDDDELCPVSFVNRPHTSACNHRPMTRMSNGVRSSLGKMKSTSSIPDFKADNVLLRRHKTEFLSPPKYKVQRNRAMSPELSPEDALELDDKRTFLDDLDSAYSNKVHALTEADVNPQFVYVQTLTKGDVFGLAQCLFCDQPSLCVVSNGADCILMSKNLFLDNCSSEIIRRLRVEVSPYPSEEKLQEDLVTRVNWDVYKDAIRKQIYTQHRDRQRHP